MECNVSQTSPDISTIDHVCFVLFCDDKLDCSKTFSAEINPTDMTRLQ